tara:strand:+ start:562 stop:1029 length:468 start_codon:yes stop_codon:yes gene_type:complete
MNNMNAIYDFQTKHQLNLERSDINTLEYRVTNIEKYITEFLTSQTPNDAFILTSVNRYMLATKELQKRHREITIKYMDNLKAMEQRYGNLRIELNAEIKNDIMYPPIPPRGIHSVIWPMSSIIICTITPELLILAMVICSVIVADYATTLNILKY